MNVPEPGHIVQEMARALRPGGRLLLIVPHEWEEHQQPHDYFRYTRYGVRYLVERSGLCVVELRPAGGAAACVFAPSALLLPLLEPLDRRRNFTLGFVCVAANPVSSGAALEHPC